MKDTSEKNVLVWYIASLVVGFVIGTLQPYQPQILPWIQSFWDESKVPCEGKLSITTPTDRSLVSGDLIEITGKAQYTGACKCVVLIVNPLSGDRARFVSDTQPIFNGCWTATARIGSIPIGGKCKVTARLCSVPPPYPDAGCLQSPPLQGIASNTITIRRKE